MDRPVAAALLALLLVASGMVSAGGALGAPPADRASLTAGSAGPSSLETQGDFDRTEFRITVYENGSARWTFRYLRTLNNESERQQFRDYAEEFNSNETALFDDFQNRSQSLVRQGENVTGRSMTARGFSKEAYVDQTTGSRGVVEMSFLWTNFARTQGDRVKVGDVFQGGLYLGQDQALTFRHGPNLQFYEATPDPNSTSPPDSVESAKSITYTGQRNFEPGHPYVEFGPPRDSPTTTDTTEGPIGPGDDDGLGFLPMFALFVAMLLGLGAVYAYRTGALDRGSGGSGGEANTDGGSAGAGVAGAGAAADTTPEPAISDEELLSDEDRVLKLLEERGGRMKQVKIVEETGWSKSKVSMLLSDMEDAGQVSKLRVGRENIVSLAGHEPDAAGSPFDDEG